MTSDDHAALVDEGARLHAEGQFTEALGHFARAFELAPLCPAVLYNLANTYFLLEREEASLRVVDQLLTASDQDLRVGCPNRVEEPEEHKLSALFVKFRALLFSGRPWEEAQVCLDSYWARRAGGTRSVYSDEEVRHWVEYYRGEFLA